jgi:hypothetical protein
MSRFCFPATSPLLQDIIKAMGLEDQSIARLEFTFEAGSIAEAVVTLYPSPEVLAPLRVARYQLLEPDFEPEPEPDPWVRFDALVERTKFNFQHLKHVLDIRAERQQVQSDIAFKLIAHRAKPPSPMAKFLTEHITKLLKASNHSVTFKEP